MLQTQSNARQCSDKLKVPMGSSLTTEPTIHLKEPEDMLFIGLKWQTFLEHPSDSGTFMATPNGSQVPPGQHQHFLEDQIVPGIDPG